MKLYTYFRSSAAFRVRIALNLKGLEWEPEVIWLVSGEQGRDPYKKLNPQGLVPTLVDGDLRLSQSMAIIEYLDETHPEPPLLANGAAGRARIRSLAQLVACDIHPLNNLRVLKYLKSKLGQEQPAIDDWYRHWCREGLAAYECELENGPAGRFSHGDGPTIADICLVPQVFNARRFDLDLKAYPRSMAVFDACMALPAFDAAQPSKQADASRAQS
ncbi:MAG: maleylacetoacetate isomerase [Burkholderiaceae bacterium]|jgi:maleylacetoacetate isomerase